MASKPILHTIPAFDAEFGTSGKESLSVPIFKFSWKDSVARYNKLEIVDYSTNKQVYVCTMKTMRLQHELHRSGTNENEDEKITQTVVYNLKNGKKYKARIYVGITNDGDILPTPSDWVIFYCFPTAQFEFTNFSTFSDKDSKIAIVNANSLDLSVIYNDNQSNGSLRESLKSYYFQLKDYLGNVLITSDTFYSSLSEDILRYRLGGMTETSENEDGSLRYDEAYTIGCYGETQHGIVVFAEQKFVIKVDAFGVGALVSAKNMGDGRILISSNYKIINANCSTETPTYIYDEDGNPYAVDFTQGDYVEFIDGFTMNSPYEIIFNGSFKVGTLITLRNSEKEYGYIGLGKITYTTKPWYYFYFRIEKNGVEHEVRTDYFRCYDELVTAKVDFSYQNGLYNIKCIVETNNTYTYTSSDDNNGTVTFSLLTDNTINYDESDKILSINAPLLEISELNGIITIEGGSD